MMVHCPCLINSILANTTWSIKKGTLFLNDLKPSLSAVSLDWIYRNICPALFRVSAGSKLAIPVGLSLCLMYVLALINMFNGYLIQLLIKDVTLVSKENLDLT